jgi:hypothetical protein
MAPLMQFSAFEMELDMHVYVYILTDLFSPNRVMVKMQNYMDTFARFKDRPQLGELESIMKPHAQLDHFERAQLRMSDMYISSRLGGSNKFQQNSISLPRRPRRSQNRHPLARRQNIRGRPRHHPQRHSRRAPALGARLQHVKHFVIHGAALESTSQN